MIFKIQEISHKDLNLGKLLKISSLQQIHLSYLPPQGLLQSVLSPPWGGNTMAPFPVSAISSVIKVDFQFWSGEY